MLFLWQPAAYRHALEVGVKIDAPVFSDTGCCLTVNVSFTSFVGCQVNIIKSKRGFCDEDVGATQKKLGKQRHLQFAASCSIIEVSAARSDE